MTPQPHDVPTRAARARARRRRRRPAALPLAPTGGTLDDDLAAAEADRADKAAALDAAMAQIDYDDLRPTVGQRATDAVAPLVRIVVSGVIAAAVISVACWTLNADQALLVVAVVLAALVVREAQARVGG